MKIQRVSKQDSVMSQFVMNEVRVGGYVRKADMDSIPCLSQFAILGL